MCFCIKKPENSFVSPAYKNLRPGQLLSSGAGTGLEGAQSYSVVKVCNNNLNGE